MRNIRKEKFKKKNKKRIIIISISLIAFILILFLALNLVNIVNGVKSRLFPDTSHNIVDNKYSLNGKLYFVKDKDLWEISGKEIKKITKKGNIKETNISNSGKIVYTNVDILNADLFLLNSDQTSIPLTKNASGVLERNHWAASPVISPDENFLLYLSDKNKDVTGRPDLSVYQMNLNTKVSTKLTNANYYTGGDQDPVYYPLDQDLIMYDKYSYFNNTPQPISQIYILNLQTRKPYTLSPDEDSVLQANFSSDGKYITYIKRENDSKQMNLYIMPFNISNLDSINPQKAFLDDYNKSTLLYKGFSSVPVFSPDNKSIAFITEEKDNMELNVLDLKYTTQKDSTVKISASAPIQLTNKGGINATSRLSWIK